MARAKDIETTVLISGAGVAGPMLGWWLKRYGFSPTIVEKAPELRKGGHSVDLWGSAAEVMERMGVLPALEAVRTRNDRGVTLAPGRAPVEIDLGRLGVELADRHVEIMRGELVSILHDAGKADIDYVFGDSIASLDERDDGVGVTFESGRSREFALVVGADGQHSRVRQLAFGPEADFSRYIGGYVCGCTIPNVLGLDGAIHRYVAPGRTIAVFPIRQSGDLGVAFLFRRSEPFDLHHDDVEGQKRVLRDLFANNGWEAPRLLNCLDQARDFYFESFTQIRMQSWTKDRIALVGDAGYGPGPAVGGGTSLAVVGACILAGELAEAAGDIPAGLRNYEAALRDVVTDSRRIGPALVKSLIPSSDLAIDLGPRLLPVLTALPGPVRRRLPILPRQATKGLRAIARTPLRLYRTDQVGAV